MKYFQMRGRKRLKGSLTRSMPDPYRRSIAKEHSEHLEQFRYAHRADLADCSRWSEWAKELWSGFDADKLGLYSGSKLFDIRSDVLFKLMVYVKSEAGAAKILRVRKTDSAIKGLTLSLPIIVFC